MRTLIACLILAALLALPVSGGGKRPEFDLALDALTDAGGNYTYRGIEYGSSPEEAGKALGLELGEPDVAAGTIATYNVEADFKLDGALFYLVLDFKDGGLQSFTFQRRGEETPGLYLETAKELTERYGVSTWKFDRQETKAGTTEYYRWAELEGTRTSLAVSLQSAKDGGSPQMNLTLDLLPDGDPPATLTPGTPPPL